MGGRPTLPSHTGSTACTNARHAHPRVGRTFQGRGSNYVPRGWATPKEEQGMHPLWSPSDPRTADHDLPAGEAARLRKRTSDTQEKSTSIRQAVYELYGEACREGVLGREASLAEEFFGLDLP